MERVEEAAGDVFENDIEMYLKIFCEENNITDMTTEPQSRWNACLMYINKYVFKGTNKLKLKGPLNGYHNNNLNLNNSSCGAYDINIINNICDIYIYLCGLYDKEVSIMGFSKLTGVNYETLMRWGRKGNELGTSSYDTYKKLLMEREESLSSKLATGNKNPVGILAILNKHYQWNLPGVKTEQNRQIKTAEQLPQLGENSAELVDNSQPEDISNCLKTSHN